MVSSETKQYVESISHQNSHNHTHQIQYQHSYSHATNNFIGVNKDDIRSQSSTHEDIPSNTHDIAPPSPTKYSRTIPTPRASNHSYPTTTTTQHHRSSIQTPTSRPMHVNFDCFSGAAGDMLLSSCLDASPDHSTLLATISEQLKQSIPEIREEFTVSMKRIWRGGMGTNEH